MSLNLSGNFNDVNRVTNRSGNVTVGLTTTELRIGGTDLEGRQTLVVYNDSNKRMYIGDSSVTISNGQPLDPRARAYINFGEENRVYIISNTASLKARLWESS